MKRYVLLAVPLLVMVGRHAEAQTSASFKLTEHTINAGGHPQDAVRPASAGFRVSFGAIGDSAGSALSSSTYAGNEGFVGRYAPPGEVQGIRFVDKINLTWNHRPSIGTYNLYRNTLASLPGNFGGCYQSTLPGASFGETDTPGQSSGWHYLVTAKNRLGEEGTKGHTSSGGERNNPSACP